VLGVRTNIAFLIALLEHPAFVEGRVDTGLLDREGDALRTAIDADLPLAAFAAAAVHQMGAVSATSIATPAARRELVPADPFVSLGAWRIR
jgi:acetyl/propionyl-CoA carboxylase alpha subunit